MHSNLNVCVIIPVALLYLCLFGNTEAQNCALPQIVSLAEDCDVKTECAVSGTILTTLSTKNVQSVRIVTQTVPNHVKVKFDKDTLRLAVNVPLLGDETNPRPLKTYIDETWSESVEVQVELSCTDGRNKSTKFTLPLCDQNTQLPFFQKSSYNITMGPCYNGTHNQACPLNFETPIIIYDADRDARNAKMEFYTDRSESIRINYTALETNVDNKQGRSNHHQQNIYLYLLEGDRFSIGDVLPFDLTGCNVVNMGNRNLNHCTITKVTIHFGESDEFPNILRPPIFTNMVYHATVSSLHEGLIGSELDIRPNPVATVPSSNTLEGEVLFSIQSNIFAIDPYSAKIHFIQDLSSQPPEFWDDVVKTYQIDAIKASHPFLRASVQLAVFLNIGTDVTEPPSCTTTTDNPETTEMTTIPTTPEESTTPDSTPTTTPKDEMCCEKCDFHCPKEEYMGGILYPDPNDCQVFHQCSYANGEVTNTPQTCSGRLIFCPNRQTCIYPDTEQCNCMADPVYNGTTPVACDSCNGCVDSLDPDNVCTTPGINPDPKYCDVFHDCRPGGPVDLIDCSFECPRGTAFCEMTNECGYMKDCPCFGRLPRRCDVCKSYYFSLGIRLFEECNI